MQNKLYEPWQLLYIYIYMCKLFVLHTNKLVGLESVFFYTLIWKTRCRLALKNEEHEERMLSTSAKHAQVCELYDGKRRCAYPFPCHHRQCRRKGGAELILTIIALCTKKKKRLASHWHHWRMAKLETVTAQLKSSTSLVPTPSSSPAWPVERIRDSRRCIEATSDFIA